jgi:hypothetical protein
MEELKEILVFIGFVLWEFIIGVMASMAYIFIVIVVTMTVFFLAFGILESPYPFLLYLVLLAVVNRKIRKIFFFKRRLQLNLMYLYYLEGDRDFSRPAKLPGLTENVHMSSRQPGLKFIPVTVIAAAAALRIKTGQTVEPPTDMGPYYRLLLLQALVFVVIAIPFGLISFLFSVHMSVGGALAYLIYLLGFFFAYFLNTALAEPIISLLAQKRMYLANG